MVAVWCNSLGGTMYTGFGVVMPVWYDSVSFSLLKWLGFVSWFCFIINTHTHKKQRSNVAAPMASLHWELQEKLEKHEQHQQLPKLRGLSLFQFTLQLLLKELLSRLAMLYLYCLILICLRKQNIFAYSKLNMSITLTCDATVLSNLWSQIALCNCWCTCRFSSQRSAAKRCSAKRSSTCEKVKPTADRSWIPVDMDFLSKTQTFGIFNMFGPVLQ